MHIYLIITIYIFFHMTRFSNAYVHGKGIVPSVNNGMTSKIA